MPAPSLMYEHTLTAVKGWLPGNMGTLDCEGRLHSEITFDVAAGKVVHIDSIETVGRKNVPIFKLGAEKTQMAIFLSQGSDAFDVSNPGTTPAGNFMHTAIAPTGINSGLVATGGFELAVTEFDASKTYNPNDLLQAPVGTNATTSGRLTNANGGSPLDVPYEDDIAVVGVVSRAKYKNEHKIDVLQFWPVYCPAHLG